MAQYQPSAPATSARPGRYSRAPTQANTGSVPAQPAQPTFQNIAREQGELNQQAAYDQFLLSNPNINSPYGNVNWEGAPGERGTVTTTLSPEQQQTYDQSNRLMNQGLMSTQLGQDFDMGGVPSAPGFDLSSLPNAPTFNTSSLQNAPNFNLSGLPQAPSFDNSSLPGGPDLNNTLTRDKLAQALIDRDQPFMDRNRSGIETQLSNQGIMQGSEAYQNKMDDLSRSENDFRLGAYARAGDEQAREYGLQADARGRAFNELESQFGMQSDARGQAVDEKSREYGLQADARSRGFDELTTGFDLAKDARSQALGEKTREYELQSDARQKMISELLTKRQLPLNELNALRTGAQVTPPQAQSFGGYNYNPADIYGAYADQQGLNLSQRNANQASHDNFMNGLFGLGGAFLLSDRRAKENSRKVGMTDSGFNLYDFNYIGDPTVRRSVMADEVEAAMPWAVITGEDGFKRVDTYYV